MKQFVALMAVVLLASSTGLALAKVNPDLPPFPSVTQAPMNGYLEDDLPVPDQGSARADTVVFGYYTIKPDGLKYAVLGGEWNFDHAAADPLEGWTSVDQTANDQTYWRQLTETKWIAEGGALSPVFWPAITGDGMVLCGATQGHADSLAWVNGIGYGNDWCQRLTSPMLTYSGTGTIDLSLQYFSESEADYDFTKIFIESGAGRVMINSPGFTGKIGIDMSVTSVPEAKDRTMSVLTPVSYQKTLSNLDLGGGTDPRTFRVVIEFTSDGGMSDEDGRQGFDSFYGGIGLDDISLDGANLVPPTTVFYGFENDLEGWTATKCPGIGSFMGQSNMSQYIPMEPWTCRLSNNVLEMHDDSYQHPDGQHEMLYTPIVDRENDIPGGAYLTYNRILAEWDQYSDLPLANGVFHRPGWTYYPYENPRVPGLTQWSPRIGQSTWYYAGDTPACDGPPPHGYLGRTIGTDWGLPADAEKVRFIYEIHAGCEEFGVDPCSGVTNFTPIIDNITVRNAVYVNAPVALFNPGTRFQDGYGPSGWLSTTDPGNADIVYDLHMGSQDLPTKLGDSLMVSGPSPTSATKWEAKLWFRLKRMGPGQNSPSNPGLATFNQWKTVVTNNKGDFYTGAQPNFAWGYMDSVEVPAAQRNRFCSQFREFAPGGGVTPEPCFNWGGGTGDQGEGNEMLPDGVFTPGTKIEYFITTNYILTPTAYYFYPDTTGRVYQEFEVLPSFRAVSGVDKFPCVLYVDAFNGGAHSLHENALNEVLNGLGSGDAIPDPTTWDRYDYRDASSNWNGPLYRMSGGNSGASLPQLLGYKLIMVSTGASSVGTMESRDWQGFQLWLDTVGCTGNANLQGFIADGTSVAEIMSYDSPSLLNDTLGATFTCPNYSDWGCAPAETDAQNDRNYCVRVEPTVGSPLGAGNGIDVFGNVWTVWLDVLGATGTGVGSKVYEKIDRTDDYQTHFAQVINDKIGGTGSNYRSVVQSCSYEVLIARDMNNLGLDECRYHTGAEHAAARIAAVSEEIQNAIKWTLNISNPQTQVGLCINPCEPCAPPCGRAVNGDGAGGAVTRLYENHPNPFNPRTAIKFSLAADGPAKLIIYDVSGRRVRTLVDQGLQAGTHEVVWEGTDDAGHPVTSGVYWSQLQAGAYASNKKMVVLK